jgi:3-dehydroquinate dehydratase-1
LAESRPRISVAVTNGDVEAIERVEPLVDMFEVRIDLIGESWREVVGYLSKPWIACNRIKAEGGQWPGSEPERIKELMSALELGASIIDIELSTPGVDKIAAEIKGRAECLISYHNLVETPPLDRMRQIIINQLAAGAEVCKVVTTARSFADNLAVLQLINAFPATKVVAFAMGDTGQISRILCPLAGGYFTYASVGEGRASASGQITASELAEIYRILRRGS